MTLPELAQVVASVIFGLGVFIAGLGWGYSQFKKGSNQFTAEDINLFNEQLTALKKIIDEQRLRIAELRVDISSLTEQIGKLKGINEEKEKKIKELIDLVTNRDPTLIEYLKFAREAIMEFKEGFKNIDGKVNQLLSDGKIK